MDKENYLKPKTRKELAQELGISRRTLYKRLQELNLPTNRGELLMADCLKIIYERFGYPKSKGQ